MAATFSSVQSLLPVPLIKSQQFQPRSSFCYPPPRFFFFFIAPSETLSSTTRVFPTSPSLCRRRSPVFVASAQSNFLKVIQTAVRIGKDGIEAGTNLVPDSVPRPVARISVAIVAFTVGLFLLKSFISTALFVLGMMAFIYFVFIAINKDEGPGGDSSSPSTDEETTLEEARRIMEKYKTVMRMHKELGQRYYITKNFKKL